MTGFKPLAVAAVVLLAFAAPAQASKNDADRDVTLHIEADAAIPPDRAEIFLPLAGQGATREEALRDYAAKQASITAGLATAGIDSANIKTSVAKDDASAARMAAMEAADAARDAASDAAGTARTVKVGGKSPPVVAVSGSMTITVDDLKKLDRLQEVARANDIEVYQMTYGGRFYSSDPAAANKAAREQAIAKARSEADAYAAAMGYHVVRIIHVSNTSPPFNMRDLQKIASYADMGRSALQPSFFASAAYATVGIDFVIAPN